VRKHQFVIYHLAHHIEGNFLNFLKLVACPEPVKKVKERNPGAKGGGMGDYRQIHHFLHAVGSKHRPAGLPAGHHVLVVAENIKGAGGQGPRGYMEHRRSKFPGNLVHIGNHQEQALRGGKSGTHSACDKRPVNRARGPRFRLHLDHLGNSPPNIFSTLGGKLIRHFPHRAGRGNRVYRDYFT